MTLATLAQNNDGSSEMNLFPATRATPLPGGYMGKILRVDLSRGSLKDENVPEEPILKKFIGGQALALYILLRELPLDATPFGPENSVVMMTGPLTGNGFTPGGTKMTAVYLSPLTGNTLGRGATSGYWGTYLKAAGYDGIILNGASRSPVYLYIKKAAPSCVTLLQFGVSARGILKIACANLSATATRAYCVSGPQGKISTAPQCWRTTTIISPPIAAGPCWARKNSRRSWFPALCGRVIVTRSDW